MKSAHALELLTLFGRPYANPSMYSEPERGVAGNMIHAWGRFANASQNDDNPFYQDVPSGKAFVIQVFRKSLEASIWHLPGYVRLSIGLSDAFVKNL